MDPLSHSGQASRPLAPNSVAHFSCGVIDIVEYMSRRVFLTAVPPRESFFLNFYDVTLPDFRIDSCVDVYVLMTTIVYLPHLSFISRTASCMTLYPC